VTAEPAPSPVVVRSRNTTLPPTLLDHDRIEPLYEIQSVLAQRVDIENACDAFLPIVTRVLPVRTVVLLDTTQGVNRALQWATAGIPGAELEAARDHAQTTLRYLARADLESASIVSRVALLAGGVVEQTTPRHFITLPLVVHGHVFGVFQLEGASTFGERDLLFIDMVVNQLAVALDRHHVQLELETARFEAERANRRLRELQAISEAVLEGSTLDESLAAVLPVMCSIFGTDAAAVLLASADGKTLRRRSSVGLEDASDHEVAVGTGAVGRIAAGTTAMFFDDLDDVEGVSPALMSNRIRSLLGAPMHARNRMTGVVYVASRGRRGFAHDELQLLELAADRIGTIIDNAALYEQALAAIRSRDAVMGVVSHDLRGPLSTILMSTELIESDDPELVKPVAVIKRSVDLMVRLIADLRDVGSIEAGHLSIRTRPEAAAELVRDAIEGIEDAAAQKTLRLAVKLPARDRMLDCDRFRIIQVLTNLLSNAIKFTPKGGSITLSMMEVEPNQARFSVEDTGAGIAEADLPYVFDRYWQATATAHLGTGLGLAITRGIVEAHGGAISVESRVGQGTTFSFTLPLAAQEATRADARASAQAARVLVVDDEPNALSALASLLEEEGFVVETAINGLVALPMVRDFAPDILVVDLEMPGLKGDDLIHKVREQRSELPVILMTGHDDHVVATARKELGAGYISKPFDIDELVAAIHRALEKER
jgi:signal transduction histidine kinase/ActR/RegA family two-component response regulator